MPRDVDAEVKSALARGDTRAAVEATMEVLGPELRGYLHATVRDADGAAELYGELGEQLMIGIPRFRGESSVRTYVYAIAWNLVRYHRRRTRRERARQVVEADDSRLEAPDPRTPTAPHLRTTSKLRLAEARSKLTPEELTLIVLRVDRGMAWSEIGAILGVGTAAADTAVLRKRFERLVRRLRDFIRRDEP